MTFVLDEHGLIQRRDSLMAMLDDIGETMATDRGRDDTVRYLSIHADIPYAEDPAAFISYEEVYDRAGTDWRLREHLYEFQMRPGPGRRAFHLHEGLDYHFHCVDPARPDVDHHYRGHAVDVFEAHRSFLRLAAQGTVTCEEFFPLFSEYR